MPSARFFGSLSGSLDEITHYIYHIPGKKFGCTKNFERRTSNYGRDVKKIIILHEILYNCTDNEAGDRERHWNIQLGYKPGAHYGLGAKSYRKGGNKTAELGKGGFQTMTGDQRREVAALIVSLGVGIHSLSSEDKAAAARKSHVRQKELGVGVFGSAARDIWRSAGIASAASEKASYKQTRQCTHCGVVSNPANIGRWHGDNCHRAAEAAKAAE